MKGWGCRAWRGYCVFVNVSQSDDEIDDIYTDAYVHLEDYHNSCTPSCIAQRGVTSPCFHSTCLRFARHVISRPELKAPIKVVLHTFSHLKQTSSTEEATAWSVSTYVSG